MHFEERSIVGVRAVESSSLYISAAREYIISLVVTWDLY